MNQTNLVVMTTAITKPELKQETQQALCDVAEAARAEAGCIDYRIFCSTEDPKVTVNFERWESDEARNTFNAGDAVQKFGKAVSGAFAEPPQQVYYRELS